MSCASPKATFPKPEQQTAQNSTSTLWHVSACLCAGPADLGRQLHLREQHGYGGGAEGEGERERARAQASTSMFSKSSPLKGFTSQNLCELPSSV